MQESSNQKTSASSDNKKYNEDLVMIKKKVRAFGTPDS